MLLSCHSHKETSCFDYVFIPPETKLLPFGAAALSPCKNIFVKGMAFGAINARSASARSRRLAAGLIAAAEDTLRCVTRLRGFAEAVNNHALPSHNDNSVAELLQ